MSISLQIFGEELIPQNFRRPCLSAIKKILNGAQLGDVILSISFVSSVDMTGLNQKYRGKNMPTDVLSFAAQEGEIMPGMENILGDLVICVERAKEQADEFGHTLVEEIAVLTAHGLLHLLGLDHERGAEEARLQAECEMGLLDLAGFKPEIALIGRSLVA